VASTWQDTLDDTPATESLGAALGRALLPGTVIYLTGDLGAGKTTLVRGLLRQLGFEGIVRSPTYTLLEPYRVGGWALIHLDLYRIDDPEELENLGLRDQLNSATVVLVEWPARGTGHLPRPDLDVLLTHQDPGRGVCIKAATLRGGNILGKIADN